MLAPDAEAVVAGELHEIVRPKSPAESVSYFIAEYRFEFVMRINAYTVICSKMCA